MLNAIKYIDLFRECFPKIQFPTIGLLEDTKDAYITELPYNPIDLIKEKDNVCYINVLAISEREDFKWLLPQVKFIKDNINDLNKKLLSKNKNINKNIVEYYISKFNEKFPNHDDNVPLSFFDTYLGENWGEVKINYNESEGNFLQKFNWNFKNKLMFYHKSDSLYDQFLRFAKKEYTYKLRGIELIEFINKKDFQIKNSIDTIYKSLKNENPKKINGYLFLSHNKGDENNNFSLLKEKIKKALGLIDDVANITIENLYYSFYLSRNKLININKYLEDLDYIGIGKNFKDFIFFYNFGDKHEDKFGNMYWKKPSTKIGEFFSHIPMTQLEYGIKKSMYILVKYTKNEIFYQPNRLLYYRLIDNILETLPENFKKLPKEIYIPLSLGNMIKKISIIQNEWFKIAKVIITREKEFEVPYDNKTTLINIAKYICEWRDIKDNTREKYKMEKITDNDVEKINLRSKENETLKLLELILELATERKIYKTVRGRDISVTIENIFNKYIIFCKNNNEKYNLEYIDNIENMRDVYEYNNKTKKKKISSNIEHPKYKIDTKIYDIFKKYFNPQIYPAFIFRMTVDTLPDNLYKYINIYRIRNKMHINSIIFHRFLIDEFGNIDNIDSTSKIHEGFKGLIHKVIKKIDYVYRGDNNE